LFLVYNEIVGAGSLAENIAYMIDQSHNIEPKLEAVLVSIMNCQEAYTKALIVDRKSLREAQQSGDVLGAHTLLKDAYQTDVRPLLMKVREEMGLSPDPLATLRADDYPKKIIAERGIATSAGSSFQS